MTRDEWKQVNLGTIVAGGNGSIGRIISWFNIDEDEDVVHFVIEDYLGYTWVQRQRFLNHFRRISVEHYLKECVQSLDIDWKEGEESRKRVKSQIQANMIKE